MMQQQPAGGLPPRTPAAAPDSECVSAPGLSDCRRPSWINTERYDIVAKAEDGTPPETPSLDRTGPNRIQLMIRSLLAERFQLVAHDGKRGSCRFMRSSSRAATASSVPT
jgi:hypothetical protein